MTAVNFLAMLGTLFDNLLAIISVIGSAGLLLCSALYVPYARYRKLTDWSLLGLIFGAVFQVCIFAAGSKPENIGIILPMRPVIVNGLLGLSLLLLLIFTILNRNRSWPKYHR